MAVVETLPVPTPVQAIVLVLVDKRRLDPWLMAADLCLPSLCGDLGYTGHYILLVR